MPASPNARGNRLYTDEATAGLEKGLQFDSKDLTMKTLSQTHRRAAKHSNAAGTADDVDGPPALAAAASDSSAGSSLTSLLHKCSRISGALLNLSEDIRFQIAPKYEPPRWARPRSSASDKSNEQKSSISSDNNSAAQTANGNADSSTAQESSGVGQDGGSEAASTDDVSSGGSSAPWQPPAPWGARILQVPL